VDPLGLVCKAGAWYLVAAVPDGAGAGAAAPVRTYRVDRIVAATVLDERAERPVGFDLAGSWRESSAAFNRSMLRERVRLRLGPRAVANLRYVADAQAALDAVARAGEPDAEGWREVELAVESVPVAAHQLVALGGEVEALEPPALRTMLAEVGRAIVARHR
jgi:predicted DNA-binding transcriptional regulator YafY